MTDRDERPGYEFVVERGKIREFATATKSSNPAYFDDANPVAPTTFLVASSFWAPRRRPSAEPAGGGRSGGGGGAPQGGSMARVLDGGREFIYYGPPPRAGAKLSVTGRQVDQYTKEGRRGGTMTFTVSASEFRDESGRLVAEIRSTSIVTSRPPTQEGS